MTYVFLALLGVFLIGVVVFGILISFSLNEKARQSFSNRVNIYMFPRMFQSKYYRPERLWVRKGIIICSLGFFTTLFFIFIFTISSNDFNFKLKSPEGRGNPPFNLDIN